MIFCKTISKRNIKICVCPIVVISILIYVTYAFNYEYGLSAFNFINKKRPHVDLNKILYRKRAAAWVLEFYGIF